MVAPWLATPAVGRQQRLHAGEDPVGELEHRRLLELVAFQECDAIQPQRHQQQNAAVVLGPVDGTGDRVQVCVNGHRACLGGNSLTYEVQQTSSGWMVSGITAYGPVA